MSMRLVRVVSAVVTVGAIGLLGMPPATSSPPPRSFDIVRAFAQDPQPEGRFGDRMTTAGDLDGDGVNDLWIGVYRWDAIEAGLENTGRVYALSGRTLEAIYVIRSPEPQSSKMGFAGFGWSITNLGDIDGDNIDDIAVGSVSHNVHTGSGTPCGTPEPNGCNEAQGKAWVFGGADGTLLYDLDNPRPQGAPGNIAAFGWVGTAGDVTGDGISEVLVGAFGNDFPAGCASEEPIPEDCRKDQGQAFIFNGDPDFAGDDRLIRVLDMPPEDRNPTPCLPPPGPPTRSPCGGLGIVAQGLGDVDGDGVPDQSVTAWTFNLYTGTGEPCGAPEPNGCFDLVGRVYVYSGDTGEIIHKIDNPEPRDGTLFGLQIVEAFAPGDVTGDGRADIYGNGFVQPGPAGSGQGKSWVFDGATGRVLYALEDPTPELGGQFGYSLASTFYNGDDTPDLYIGSSPHHVPGSPQLGGTYIFDGHGGRLLESLELPAGDAQPGGEGNLGPQLGRSVAAPGDLNGDGLPDYVAAAPTMDVHGIQDTGVLYAFMSEGQAGITRGPCKGFAAGSRSDLPDGGKVIVGTAGNDLLRGTSGDDIICGLGGRDVIKARGGKDLVVGNAGDDTIDGGRGKDTIRAGRGDDTVDGRARNDVIAGGGGDDTLRGNAGFDTLRGGGGRDVLQGGTGDDVLRGGAGNDTLKAFSGDDVLNGGPGRDACKPGDGNDVIRNCER